MKKLLLLLPYLFFLQQAFSQWENNPAVNNLVVNTPASDYEPFCLTDGANGSIIIFRIADDNGYDIYAQKITASGSIAWGSTSSPVVVCNAADEQYHFHGITDGGRSLRSLERLPRPRPLRDIHPAHQFRRDSVMAG